MRHGTSRLSRAVPDATMNESLDDVGAAGQIAPRAQDDAEATLAPRLGVEPIAVTDDEMGYLQQYDWPGNVRELRNLLERSLIVGALNVSALYQSLPRPRPAAVAPPAAGVPTDLHAMEKQHILAVLDSVQGDKTQAATLLGISRRTLERRVAEWSTQH